MTSKLDEDIAREVAARLRGYQSSSPLRRFRFLSAFCLLIHQDPYKAPRPADINSIMGYGWKKLLDPQLAAWYVEALEAEGFQKVRGRWIKPDPPSIEEAPNI